MDLIRSRGEHAAERERMSTVTIIRYTIININIYIKDFIINLLFNPSSIGSVN